MRKSKFSRLGRWGGLVVVPMLGCLVASSVWAGDKPVIKGEMKPDLLYHNYCSVCHGDRGDGNSRAKNSLNPAPKDFSKATYLTREYIIQVVANGKPGTAMVAWKSQLNDKEIEALADYVRRSFVQAAADPRIEKGRNTYQKSCAGCHGERGQGVASPQTGMTRPPRDFTAPQAKLDLSRERMVASVTHGRPGTAMAGFGKQMSPQDIETVVDFVRVVFMNVSSDGGFSGTSAHTGRESSLGTTSPSAPASSIADMKATFPGALVGNAARGEKFYADNCATCHGKKGDGQGPRAYFINPKPRNFQDAASRSYLNRPAVYAAVSMGSRGTEMPAWKFVMSEQEMADVSEFVFSRFISVQDAKSAQATK